VRYTSHDPFCDISPRLVASRWDVTYQYSLAAHHRREIIVVTQPHFPHIPFLAELCAGKMACVSRYLRREVVSGGPAQEYGRAGAEDADGDDDARLVAHGREVCWLWQ